MSLLGAFTTNKYPYVLELAQLELTRSDSEKVHDLDYPLQYCVLVLCLSCSFSSDPEGERGRAIYIVLVDLTTLHLITLTECTHVYVATCSYFQTFDTQRESGDVVGVSILLVVGVPTVS